MRKGVRMQLVITRTVSCSREAVQIELEAAIDTHSAAKVVGFKTPSPKRPSQREAIYWKRCIYLPMGYGKSFSCRLCATVYLVVVISHDGTTGKLYI